MGEHNKDNHVKLDFIGNEIMLFIAGIKTGSMSVPMSTRPKINKLHIFGGDMFYATVNAYIKDLTYELVTQAEQKRRTRRWPALNFFRNTKNENNSEVERQLSSKSKSSYSSSKEKSASSKSSDSSSKDSSKEKSASSKSSNSSSKSSKKEKSESSKSKSSDNSSKSSVKGSSKSSDSSSKKSYTTQENPNDSIGSPIIFPPILLQQNAEIIGEIHDPPITNYEISFIIKPYLKSSDYSTILRFTENPSGNLEYYGDRQPLFQFLPNSFTLQVSMSSTLNPNNFFNSFVDLQNGRNSHIKLECIGEEITLFIDGVKTGSMLVPISTRPKLFQKLLVSAGDKFYAKLNSHISNLSFKRFCNYSPSTPVSPPTKAPVNMQPNIILIKQESRTCCKYGKTFGEVDGQMWVDNGCRGIFKCFGQQVICESWRYAYAMCSCEASPMKAPVPLTPPTKSPTKQPTHSPTKSPTKQSTKQPTRPLVDNGWFPSGSLGICEGDCD